ncbi:hypothetical protein [Ralstonia sp. CP]|uniref:hypothetical protein n=1 Tax=Ralstonia sp. CP TaxID=3231757 RepID=UPI00345C20AD
MQITEKQIDAALNAYYSGLHGTEKCHDDKQKAMNAAIQAALRAQVDARPVAAQQMPTPEQLRAIAREARNTASPSDEPAREMYVLAGWRAAMAAHPEASAPGLSDEARKFAAMLRTTAKFARAAGEELDPDSYDPDDPNDIKDGLLMQAKTLDECADMIERLTRASAATVAEPSDTLPERDQSKPAEQQGLFRKFIVQRVDGSDAPGGKHHGCEYFVLDMTHDPHAAAALRAYAEACAVTHPQLSADLRARHGAAQQQAEPCPESAMCPACYYGEPMESCIGKQAELGADERAAFEAWASKRRMDLRREANNPDEYLLASTADACVGWLARAAQSGQRAGVAEGWRLYSADFSMNARNPANWGTVMLTRDDSGSKWWHALSDEKREKIDLFVSGRGTTFDAALQAANEKAAIAAPTQQQEGGL